MNTLLAAFCVFLFSLTVPFTRMAALEMPPLLVVIFRLLGAGLVCGVLMLLESWAPPRKIWAPLLLTSLGSVLGFSLLTAFAMKEVPGSHGALALAALPIVTAAYSSFRDRRARGAVFWMFALLGTCLSFSFFFTKAVTELYLGDLLLGVSVFSAALGYVEGGRLSREFGGKKIMSWAIILSIPIVVLMFVPFVHTIGSLHFTWSAWGSVGYLALVSQSTGMFLWYRVLAKGPMEQVALVQLLQPFLTLLASILLLNEELQKSTWVIAALVVSCVWGASRSDAQGRMSLSRMMTSASSIWSRRI